MPPATPTNIGKNLQSNRNNLPWICRACDRIDAFYANKESTNKFMAVVYLIMFIVMTWGTGVIVLNLLGILPI